MKNFNYHTKNTCQNTVKTVRRMAGNDQGSPDFDSKMADYTGAQA